MSVAEHSYPHGTGGNVENNSHMYRWVTVSTSDGMFSSEYAVELTLADGTQVSCFVDKSLVIEQSGKFRLKTTQVSSDLQRGIDLILLPVETFETASRWVEIKAE